MTISWSSQIKLDTTGMSPEYVNYLNEAMRHVESSRTGQQFLQDLQQANGDRKVALRLVRPDDEHRANLEGVNGRYDSSRGGYYDSVPHAIILNPDLMQSLIYRNDPQMVAHLLIHEGDHAIRRNDGDRLDSIETIGAEYVLRDSMESSAQRRANEYFSEIGRGQQIYNNPLGRGHEAMRRSLCTERMGIEDADGSLTAKIGYNMSVGEGRMEQFEGDNKRLAEFLSGLGCGRVSAEIIQRHLEKNPRGEAASVEVPPTPGAGSSARVRE